MRDFCDINLKGKPQFIFLCNPPKSCASRILITFLQVNQKILTKDISHWLEVIAEILSFLQIFGMRETTTNFLKIFQKSAKKSTRKNIFLAYFGILKAN